MEHEKTDQEKFDEQVDKTGKVVLLSLGGFGIVAALMMSVIALIVSSNKTDTSAVSGGTTAAAGTTFRPASPATVSATIDHVTRGCHTLSVNGGTQSPTQTIRLAVGGNLRVQDNDVMPHQLMMVSGPQASFVGAAMTHMGAQSTVTFPSAGTYVLTTKAGEDYVKGIQTVGADNTLRIKVLVA